MQDIHSEARLPHTTKKKFEDGMYTFLRTIEATLRKLTGCTSASCFPRRVTLDEVGKKQC